MGDSIELAFNSGDGRIEIRNISKNEIRKFSSNYECADCGILYKEPEPKLFSFNNPYGACPKCQGFGKTIGIDTDLVFPEPARSISMGGVHPFKGSTLSPHQRDLLKAAKKHNIDIDKPISMLTDNELKIIWEGIDEYIGLNGFFEQLEEQSYKTQYKVLLNRYRGFTKCPACNGSRLRTSARQVFIHGYNIPKLVTLSLEDLLVYFKSITLNEYELKVGGQLLEEIIWRLQLLVDIGLEYLNLSRLSHTLSGGESQRINLSTALGSSLVGTLYVLDEPSIGMHPRDTDRLLKILFKLRNLGNTVIVVEHDPDIIKKSDYVIDMGPMAGEKGGEVIYSGKVDDITKSELSITGAYFSGRKFIEIPEKRNKGNGRFITVTNARENNLRIDEVKIPLGCTVVITGVSGSGKSTLIHDVVYGGLKKAKGNYQGNVGKFGLITGDTYFDSFELVDQTPIGRSSRSTPATYTKVFDFIRELFAQTQAARQLDWKAGHFSFNVPGGRCDTCEGEGLVTVDMQFLPDVSLVCESCKGSRYKREAMNILYNSKNIVDVLDMTIDEAAEFFTETPRIMKKLRTLQDVGLGYIKLGQPSTMLSGGESQRIKLAGHLDSGYDGATLFIFDEPTTGLHLDDISKLIKCFNQLVNRNHSVIIIEHNLSIIASADWIIDLGPEAGEKGGLLVAEGTPEKIAEVKNSYTGNALKNYFENEERKIEKIKKK
jgi:excinuclease ABC subunit A